MDTAAKFISHVASFCLLTCAGVLSECIDCLLWSLNFVLFYYAVLLDSAVDVFGTEWNCAFMLLRMIYTMQCWANVMCAVALCPFVRLSVCHKLVLYQKDETYRHAKQATP